MTQQFLINQDNLVKPGVKLVGEDGNAFAVIGRVSKAWNRMGRMDIAKEFLARATSGDYHDLLRTALEYVDEDYAWGEDLAEAEYDFNEDEDE